MKLQELLSKSYNILKQANIETYMLDAQLLLGKIINKDKMFILTNRHYHINKEDEIEFLKLIELRKRKMPVKYILGNCEFMGIDFKIREGVLIPRPDTEILVEAAIDDVKLNNYKNLCDVCCGSGVIALSIAKFLDNVEAQCYDISSIACEVTLENIKLLKLENRVKVYKSDLLMLPKKQNKKFDILVSNPPYIKEKQINELMDDVKLYEPYEALCGGEDGLYFYRKIVEQSKYVLNKEGSIVFEIGYDQREKVINILKNNGFKDIKCIKDLSGKDRVVKGKKY
ncbi:release factor glutamine methyltransferase [Clostridium acetireducens DSM 10703]|jgi:release factor glutamine methyltransferase|uniref:Release factor glutamine methyltransferase n=1 Tax=Clostridium acetireducens DSM 10703 TaxID=1121290 RepID=A0A1E8EYX3_9CLOT|nr:peptide chain release factor N(5)-glutamine methyltransferase [Clostridium acetireducens]OFI06194.1 release factor glutamine methyltransferase [Clostridium acetireducens DSM 10703]